MGRFYTVTRTTTLTGVTSAYLFSVFDDTSAAHISIHSITLSTDGAETADASAVIDLRGLALGGTGTDAAADIASLDPDSPGSIAQILHSFTVNPTAGVDQFFYMALDSRGGLPFHFDLPEPYTAKIGDGFGFVGQQLDVADADLDVTITVVWEEH